MDTLKEFSAALSTLESLSLRRRPEAEEQIRIALVLTDGFQKMSAPERDTVRQGVALSSVGMKLLSLSGYLSEVAINRDDPTLIRQALILHAIEGGQIDERENIRYLALVAYAAGKLNVAIRPLVAAISDLSSGRAQGILAAYPNRTTEQNQLRSFGIAVDESPGRFRFVPI